MICLTLIGRAVLPNTPSARNVFLISSRGGKKRKSCAGTSSWSKANVVLTHPRVLESDVHLSPSRATFSAHSGCDCAARARVTSGADKGPLVQMVSVRETPELGAERHEGAARKTRHGNSAWKISGEKEEKNRNKRDRSQRRPGGGR